MSMRDDGASFTSSTAQNLGKMDHGTLLFCQLRSCEHSSQYQNVRNLPWSDIQSSHFLSINLEGEQTPIPFSTLIKRPDLRHIGSNLRYLQIPTWSLSPLMTAVYIPTSTSRFSSGQIQSLLPYQFGRPISHFAMRESLCSTKFIWGVC